VFDTAKNFDEAFAGSSDRTSTGEAPNRKLAAAEKDGWQPAWRQDRSSIVYQWIDEKLSY